MFLTGTASFVGSFPLRYLEAQAISSKARRPVLPPIWTRMWSLATFVTIPSIISPSASLTAGSEPALPESPDRPCGAARATLALVHLRSPLNTAASAAFCISAFSVVKTSSPPL